LAKAIKMLYVRDRKEWRAWLAKHGGTEQEIWLVYPKKNCGDVRIPYDDAVEEALCFGWIDGTVKDLTKRDTGSDLHRGRGAAVGRRAISLACER
jgi:uncharacterized protein YdeI (YjbR/CyaY-like superfamily)